MDFKKRMWQRGLLFMLLGLFFACPNFIMGVETLYPYDQYGVVLGFSGVYDVWLFNKFWNGNIATQELKDWLDKIALNNGNIIRVFSFYNGDMAFLRKTISPWPRTAKDGAYVYNVDKLDRAYFTRLKAFMDLLKERKLKAWFDMWDYCGLKNGRYLTHPFWANEHFTKNEITDDVAEFVYNSLIKTWRKNFEIEILTIMRDYDYKPIFSTNEVVATNNSNSKFNLTEIEVNTFLKERTDYWKGPLWNIPLNRISHSTTLNSCIYLKGVYGSQLLLSNHGQSSESEINENLLSTYGIKVISSDGETNGAQDGSVPRPPNKLWDSKDGKNNKYPLSASQVKDSMIKALKLGFSGMEILDRDEYWEAYENPTLLPHVPCPYDPPCPGVDVYTLQNLVEAYAKSRVRVVSPNGGETLNMNDTYLITWTPLSDADLYWWGTITISLYQNSSKIGTIIDGIYMDFGSCSYRWKVGTLKEGTAPSGGNYRILIRRITASGRESVLYDISDGYFSIN